MTFTGLQGLSIAICLFFIQAVESEVGYIISFIAVGIERTGFSQFTRMYSLNVRSWFYRQEVIQRQKKSKVKNG